ncbi:hypothetical protein ACJX0J_018159, partial [Zea mays]
RDRQANYLGFICFYLSNVNNNIVTAKRINMFTNGQSVPVISIQTIFRRWQGERRKPEKIAAKSVFWRLIHKEETRRKINDICRSLEVCRKNNAVDEDCPILQRLILARINIKIY